MTTLTERINSLISQRVRYGMRTEIAGSRGYCIYWSNGSASWYCGGMINKKNEIMNLDANVVFAPLMTGEKKKDILEVLPSLKQLPLYGNSFECVWGGKTPE